jgi:hypothetical protein
MSATTQRVLLNGTISNGGSKSHLKLRGTKTGDAPPHYSDWEVVGKDIYGLPDGDYEIRVENGQTVKVRVLDGQFRFNGAGL